MQQSHTQADLSRLSLNQMTTQRWSLREAVEGCLEAGVPSIALRRERVAEIGLDEAARVVRKSGLRVSSLHVGGRFPAASEAERRARLDDNRRAIEEAAELGAEVLSLLAGAAPECDIDATRTMVEEGIEQLMPDAEQSGVKLAVEPLHPVFAAERSAVVTLSQANDMLDRLGSAQVGVSIDVYHVWWDPDLYAQIDRAAGRMVGFHINDWPVPNECPLMSRAMMGDGVIELRRIKSAVDEAGYTGPIEVEIFNQAIWDMPGKDVLRLMKDRYVEHVL
jgi:sugar phosphate isomerase/epimerase